MTSAELPRPEERQAVLHLDEKCLGELIANVDQIAVLNGKVPSGFRFELAENCGKLNAQVAKSIKRKRPVARHEDFVEPENDRAGP